MSDEIAQFEIGPRARSATAVGLFAAALVLASGFGASAAPGPLSTAVAAGITAIAATGVQLIFLEVGVLSLAHSALMGVGAYGAALLLMHVNLGFWVALALAIPLGFVGGGLLGLLLLRLRGFYFVIVTFALAGIVTLIANNWVGVLGGVSGLSVDTTQSVLGKPIVTVQEWYYIIVATLAVILVLIYLLRRTGLSRSVRAASENEALAESLGLELRGRRALVVAVSGIFPAVAGVIYAYYIQNVAGSAFSSQVGISFALVAVVGGSMPVVGPVIGSILYYFLQSFLGISAVTDQVALGAILVLITMIAPEGITGGMQRAAVWSMRRAATRFRRGGVDVDSAAA